MTESRTYSLCFAQLLREERTLASDHPLRDALKDSWRPEVTVVRHGRQWHVSGPYEIDSEIWSGELGYVTPGEVSTLEWDPQSLRFVKGNAPAGSVSPFIVDLNAGTICFQLRPGFIRPTSFTTAFREILGRAGMDLWDVIPLVKTQSFGDWSINVDRITKATFLLERPNPNYIGRPQIEQMVEELHAQAALLRVRARQGEALDSEAPLFRQAMDHIQKKYGSAKIIGEDERGDQTEWHSIDGGVSPEVQQVIADGEAEIDPNLLIRVLRHVRDRAQVRAMSTSSGVDDD
jgi:hypothetical protein